MSPVIWPLHNRRPTLELSLPHLNRKRRRRLIADTVGGVRTRSRRFEVAEWLRRHRVFQIPQSVPLRQLWRPQDIWPQEVAAPQLAQPVGVDEDRGAGVPRLGRWPVETLCPRRERERDWRCASPVVLKTAFCLQSASGRDRFAQVPGLGWPLTQMPFSYQPESGDHFRGTVAQGQPAAPAIGVVCLRTVQAASRSGSSIRRPSTRRRPAGRFPRHSRRFDRECSTRCLRSSCK